MEEYRLGELRHLLTTVFLSGFATVLLRPVMADVTVAAVCSGVGDSCSLAVYLTGVQQVTVGLGTMVMMPVIGNLSDRYGIKALLTLPMCLSILPPAILGYRMDTNFFYAFYIIKTLFDMVCQGTVDCLAQAYVAKNIYGRRRMSMFGVLAGVRSISGVCATFSARFLPIASTFQVAAISLSVGLVYMRIFLKETLHDNNDDDYDEDDDDRGGGSHQEVHDGGDLKMLAEPILRDAPTKTDVFNTKYSSLKDMVSLIKNSTILVQALVVTFFATFAQTGMHSAFMYFLKARFGFNKNDFAELFLLVNIIGSISQLFILPILVSAIGERKAACLSVAWSAWVPYATTVLVPGSMFVMPSVCGIASRQVRSGEQAENIQGSTRISGFSILAGVKTISGLFGSLAARFLPIALTFQVSAISFLVGLVYMRVFLKERLNGDENDDNHHGTHHQEDHDRADDRMLAEPILNDTPIKKRVFHKKYSSLTDMISLMKLDQEKDFKKENNHVPIN